MSTNWSIRFRSPNKRDLLPPFYVVLLVSAFVSVFGIKTPWLGLLIILVTAIVPSAINVILASWIASFFRTKLILKAAIFVPMSFLLGINTLFPKLFAPYPSQVASSSVLRTIDVNSYTRVDEGLMAPRLTDEVNHPIGPSALGIDWVWGYQCDCPWFGPGRDADYEWQVWDVINSTLHRQNGIDGVDYLDMPKDLANGVHFDVRFIKVAAVPNAVNLFIGVYEGRTRTATFEQRNLPAFSVSQDGKPSGELIRPSGELMKRELRTYSMSMLLHRNFWVYMLRNRIEGFPSKPLRSFLSRAINAA